MVLVSPVTNFLGNTLLKSGASITEDNIVTLETWGIKVVTVEGRVGDHILEQVTEKTCIEDEIHELDRMFSAVKHQPGMKMIYEIVQKQAETRLTSQKPRSQQ
jgi:hypothetical protein